MAMCERLQSLSAKGHMAALAEVLSLSAAAERLFHSVACRSGPVAANIRRQPI